MGEIGYERLAQEPQSAYRSFAHYRDSGPRRTLQATYTVLTGKEGKPSGAYVRWMREYRWSERVALYDANSAANRKRSAQEGHDADIEAFRVRSLRRGQAMREAAELLTSKVMERLRSIKPEELPLAHLPAYLRAAAALEQAGQDTEAAALGIVELQCALELDDAA